ncbi:hypothetical protein [Mycobacteroides chelonae]|uniref:hypothetical protein n=1 Tax=Mycobacteroides chelonae TaxID=1774 RepID=UPI00104250E1|nr:hypothetical protein [Mycobacteroides chelonae]
MTQSPKPLREHVAEAMRAMLEANGLEDMADEYEMADSLIASLGLELEWWIYYDDHDGVRTDYDGPYVTAEDAQCEADRIWPVLEVNGWATPPYVKPRIVSQVQEETGE